MGVIFIHIGSQVSVQGSLRLFIGSLVEVPGIGLTQKNNLKRVDYRGFPRSVFPGQEIDIIHFDEFFGEIEPVNQENLLQLLHIPPPFSAPIQRPAAFRWKPQ